METAMIEIKEVIPQLDPDPIGTLLNMKTDKETLYLIDQMIMDRKRLWAEARLGEIPWHLQHIDNFKEKFPIDLYYKTVAELADLRRYRNYVLFYLGK